MAKKSIRIKKIKLNLKKETVTVLYEKLNAKQLWDDFSLSTSEQPELEFIDVINSLGLYVNKICEFPEEDVNKIVTTGISFSHNEVDDIIGATLIAIKRLSHSIQPLSICTPHKFNKRREGFDDTMPEGMEKALGVVIHFAERFIVGNRAQISLLDAQPEHKHFERGVNVND